jgi:hypothetical protein
MAGIFLPAISVRVSSKAAAKPIEATGGKVRGSGAARAAKPCQLAVDTHLGKAIALQSFVFFRE